MALISVFSIHIYASIYASYSEDTYIQDCDILYDVNVLVLLSRFLHLVVIFAM